MTVTTGWVKPARQTKGLDPLGSQAPGILLYSQLLPGITNVTDRARYYTFYPWLIWALHEDGCTAGDQFVDLFRRGDCLFTLIAHRHLDVVGDGSDDHAAGLIGSNNLRSSFENLREDEPVALSLVASMEGSERYFKNRLGGLGQYYFGPLRDLGILNGSGPAGVQCDANVGVQFATAMDSTVDRSLFLKTLKRNEVRCRDLDALACFCPCQLPSSSQEQALLADLLANRGVLADPGQHDRRLTVRLVLHLAEALAAQGQVLDELTFRGIVYSGMLQDGTLLDLEDELELQRRRWGCYAGGDLASVACLGMFWSLLLSYEAKDYPVHSSEEIGHWFAYEAEGSTTLGDVAPRYVAVGEAAENVAARMPPISSWDDPSHELGLAYEIVRLSSGEESLESRTEVLRLSSELLLALIARGPSGTDVRGVFPPGYSEQYPINLHSLHHRVESGWRHLTLRELVSQVAAEWLVNNHVHVAMRKLAAQSEDTFRIRVGDRGYEVAQISPAVMTSPRFRQLRRILLDTGVLEEAGGLTCVSKEFTWMQDYDGSD